MDEKISKLGLKLKIIDFKTEKVDENGQMKLEMIALTIRIKKIYLLNKIQTIHKELSKRVLIFGKLKFQTLGE